MRAGRLNRTIKLLAYSVSEPNEYGNVTETWAPTATLRAEVVSLSTQEFLKAYGEVSTSAVVFRIRYRRSVSDDMRLEFEGRQFAIKEVKELGHRDGLELRCEDVAP